MAMLGKEVRMSRLVNPKSNKMMAITVDHAISRGIAPMTGLHHIQDTIDKIILGKPDFHFGKTPFSSFRSSPLLFPAL